MLLIVTSTGDELFSGINIDVPEKVPDSWKRSVIVFKIKDRLCCDNYSGMTSS